MSGGRLIIETHPNGALMGSAEIFDACNSGTIDEAGFTLHTFMGQVPSSPLFSARPLGMAAMPMMTWFEEFGGHEYMMQALEPFNFGSAQYFWITTPEDLCWSNVRMDTLASWKGVKFRTKGLWANVLQDPRVGASVVTIAGSELYNALERGILDATEYSTPGTDIQVGFYEICKYMMVPGIHQPSTTQMTVVYDETWAALPDDLKAIYTEAMHATQTIAYANNIKTDIAALRFFEELPSLEIIVCPDKLQQEFFAITDDLFKKESEKDPFFAEVYQSQLDFMKEFKMHELYQVPKF